MRGRKGKASELKLLAGTQPCRVNGQEPDAGAGRPETPAHLDDDARAEWARVCADLERVGVLTPADGPALAIYCEAWSRKRLADAEVEKYGLLTETALGGLKANPAVSIGKACDATMLRVLASFGLTPADRSRVKAQAPGAQDALAEFIAKRKA